GPVPRRYRLMGRFDGKVALVTGGASGIGLATAKAFARDGARVVIVDRNREAAERAAAEIGAAASAFAADVTDFESCEAMVAHALEHFGAVHIAFNNAGVPTPIGTEF